MAWLRVCQVNFYADPADRAPEELLAAWRVMPELAEAAAREGAEVDLITASLSHEACFERRGVRVHFVRGQVRVVEAVRRARPDIVHVHGLSFARQTLYLSLRVPFARILGTDHNDKLRGGWRDSLTKAALLRMSGVTYTARDLARTFQDAKLMSRSMPIFEVLECSTPFSPDDREGARRETGVFGDPLILWAGHLDANKDPLTVLDAIALALPSLAGIELWCCYQTAPLMDEVRARLRRSPELERRVHFLGLRPQPEIERLHRASDFLMLGSRTEGGVVASVEALACGSTPIVTDTACFRRVTGNGRHGALSPIGDAKAMSANLVAWAGRDRAELRRTARAHFERELSFSAQQRQLARAYEDLMRLPHRQWRRGHSGVG